MASKAKTPATTAAETNGSLPKGWRIVRFGDVVRDVNEAERNPLDAGLKRFVGLEHIGPENLHLKQWGNLADGDISFTKRFRKGQVLFGKRRAYQRKVAVAEFDGICSSDILTFEPKDESLIPDLLPFIVQSDGFFQHALGTSSGSLSPRTRWSQLRDYEFPLPPKNEQRRIAEILWAEDDASEQFRTLRHAVEVARNRVFEESINSQWNVIRSRRARTKRSFDKISLKDRCLRVTDGTHIPPSFSESGVPFFLVKTISSGQVDWSHTKFVSQDTYNQLTRIVRPTRGHVLYTAVGATYGVALLVDFDSPFVFQRHIAHIIPNPELLDAHFLTLFLNSSAGKRQADQTAVGTAQPTITLKDLCRFQIPNLEIDEQRRVVRMVVKFDTAMSHLDQMAESLKKVREATMAALTNEEA